MTVVKTEGESHKTTGHPKYHKPLPQDSSVNTLLDKK